VLNIFKKQNLFHLVSILKIVSSNFHPHMVIRHHSLPDYRLLSCEWPTGLTN